MKHREQFSLSVMSETVFNFRALCCLLGVPSAKNGEFEQHDSLRLKQPFVYSCMIRDNSTEPCGSTMGGTMRLSCCDVLLSSCEDPKSDNVYKCHNLFNESVMHISENSLQLQFIDETLML